MTVSTGITYSEPFTATDRLLPLASDDPKLHAQTLYGRQPIVFQDQAFRRRKKVDGNPFGLDCSNIL